jgi:ribosome maturation factor RimP
MDTISALRVLAEPVCESWGVELVDIEIANAEGGGRVLRISIDKDGGVNLDLCADVSREISRALDENDPVDGRYFLEVGSPGLERPLRTPAHFARFIGHKVAVKASVRVEGERRHTGDLISSDDDGFTIAVGEGESRNELRFAYADVERVRTVFEWATQAQRPGQKSEPSNRKKAPW